MIRSNWQGAMWRGAMLAGLFWSGLAWTQTTQRSAGDGAERIMVVHANGKSTRCRVLESWKLNDGRLAHLLQAVENNEKITIVDETAPVGDPALRNSKGVPKRIFAWGVGSETPPDGSPVPPQTRRDPGVILSSPVAQSSTPPMIVNHTPPIIVNNAASAPPMIVNNAANVKRAGDATHIEILVDHGDNKPAEKAVSVKPRDAQVIEYKNMPADKQGPSPFIFNNQPKATESAASPVPFQNVAQPRATENVSPPKIMETPGSQVCDTAPVVGNRPPIFPRVNAAVMARSEPPLYGNMPMVNPIPPGAPGSAANPIVISEGAVEPQRGWRPGDVLFGWMKKSPPPAPMIVADSAKNMQGFKAEAFLAAESKIAEKRIADRVDKMPKAPFSTAMSPSLNTPDKKTLEVAPLAMASQNKDDKPAVVAAPKDEVKTEKRDMWGLGLGDKVVSPGKSLIDPELVKLPPAPAARKSDPLTSPEKLLPSNAQMTPKATMLAPVASLPRPADMGNPRNWPLGTQSVMAAGSGLQGPVTYIPVPTVTVPQPNHPPVPPAPALPEAPQLNAYVNAFTPPPQPKPAAPTAASVPDWMQPNPAMQQQQQQQMMMQQQMMQQQMLQQQILMAQGYRPNPHMMNGYMPQGNPMPSPGPTNNGSRMYAGPMPPNTPFAAPMMPGYPPMVPMQPMQPMQPMMPQQPMQPNPAMQQVSYQQPPTPQQAMAQQVEQLVKVMRESPYPSQRETAAQSLTNFDWRVSPQIIPALVQGASQDPASSVRAGCVNCLCRMGAAVEPVLGTLHQMRNDTDPRVRQEVERALMAFGQMTPR